jgi:hypothetical protein
MLMAKQSERSEPRGVWGTGPRGKKALSMKSPIIPAIDDAFAFVCGSEESGIRMALYVETKRKH